MCIVSMKSKIEVMLALKQFTKNICAPEETMDDKSKEVKQFINSAGAALRVLEEKMPCANRA